MGMVLYLTYMPGVVDITLRPMVPEDFTIYSLAFYLSLLCVLPHGILWLCPLSYTDRDLLEETDEVPAIGVL